jgi:ferredoxin
MQVAVIAVGFTTLIFIIIVLAAALALGLGRKPDRSRQATASARPARGGRLARDDWQSRGGQQPPRPVNEPGLFNDSRPRNDSVLRNDLRPRGNPQPLRSEPRPRRNEPPAAAGFRPGGKFGVSRSRDMISIEVNPNKCARFGFCEHEAPDVFYLESDGRFGYQALVPLEKKEQVITAMDVCPRRAIKVKLPKGHDALSPPQPNLPNLPNLPNVPDETRRTVIPLHGERFTQDEDPRPRRA